MTTRSTPSDYRTRFLAEARFKEGAIELRLGPVKQSEVIGALSANRHVGSVAEKPADGPLQLFIVCPSEGVTLIWLEVLVLAVCKAIELDYLAQQARGKADHAQEGLLRVMDAIQISLEY